MQTLPRELQQILHPDMVPPSLFWGPLILGAVAGLVMGVLAMAIGMLLVNVTAVTLGDTMQPFNLQLPVIIFVLGSAVSWVIASFIIWRRWKKTNELDLVN